MLYLVCLLVGVALGAFIWVPGYIAWDERNHRMDQGWVERQRRQR